MFPDKNTGFLPCEKPTIKPLHAHVYKLLKIFCPLCSGKIMFLFYHLHICFKFFSGDNDLGFTHCIYPSIHSPLIPTWPTIYFCKMIGLFTIKTQVYRKESHFLLYVSFPGKRLSSSPVIFLPTEQPNPQKMYTHLHVYKYLYVTKSKCIFYSQTHEYSYIIH